MPPQPLSYVKRDAVVKWGTDYAFQRNPDLAILALRAIAGWAHAEAFMQETLVHMLGARAEPAARMYTAMVSAQARRAALLAAAECSLEPKHLELLRAIMKATGPMARARHRLAHDLWCYSDDLPDALLLLESEASFGFAVDRNRFQFSPNALMKAVKGAPIFPVDRIFVYREKDLSEIVGQMADAANYFAQFHTVVSSARPAAESNYRELTLEPPIQEALARLRKQAGNSL